MMNNFDDSHIFTLQIHTSNYSFYFLVMFVFFFLCFMCHFSFVAELHVVGLGV